MIVLENLKMPLCGWNRKILKKIRERFESSKSWILGGSEGDFSEREPGEREREGAFSEWNQVGKQAEGGLLVNGTEKFLKKSSM